MPKERVEAALLNFFTTANLGTLREVALREATRRRDLVRSLAVTLGAGHPRSPRRTPPTPW